MTPEFDPSSVPPEFLVAVHDFKARSSDELDLEKGDYIEVLETDDGFSDGWYMGRNITTKQVGLFPYVYSTVGPSKTEEEYFSNDGMSSDEELSNPEAIPQANVKHASMYEDIENTLSGLESGSRSRSSEEYTSVKQSPQTWNTYQVAQHFAKNNFDLSICNKFIEHKITGAILLELELAHLKEIDINSFGTRFEIFKVIERYATVYVFKWKFLIYRKV